MGANSGFEASQPQRLPFWLADDQGTAFEASFGRTKDDGLALLQQSVRARYPWEGRPDALAYAGRDRLILRAPHEDGAHYAARLLAAHDTWQWGGTTRAIVDIMAPYGYDATNMVVLPNHAVILEGDPTWFSRWIELLGRVFFHTDVPWDDIVDQSAWSEDTPETWDSTAQVGDENYLRASVRIMKADCAYPVLAGVELLGGVGDGFWDGPSPDAYDDPGAVWSDAVEDDVVVLPLAWTWDDQIYYGGAEWCWDSGVEGDVWDEGDGPFVPPSTGWGWALT